MAVNLFTQAYVLTSTHAHKRCMFKIDPISHKTIKIHNEALCAPHCGYRAPHCGFPLESCYAHRCLCVYLLFFFFLKGWYIIHKDRENLTIWKVWTDRGKKKNKLMTGNYIKDGPKEKGMKNMVSL